MKRPARRAWPGGTALSTTPWPLEAVAQVLFPSYRNASLLPTLLSAEGSTSREPVTALCGKRAVARLGQLVAEVKGSCPPRRGTRPPSQIGSPGQTQEGR